MSFVARCRTTGCSSWRYCFSLFWATLSSPVNLWLQWTDQSSQPLVVSLLTEFKVLGKVRIEFRSVHSRHKFGAAERTCTLNLLITGQLQYYYATAANVVGTLVDQGLPATLQTKWKHIQVTLYTFPSKLVWKARFELATPRFQAENSDQTELLPDSLDFGT